MRTRERGQTPRPLARFSVEELAAELGLGRQTVYAGLRNGSIPSVRVGKRFIIPRAVIARWLRT